MAEVTLNPIEDSTVRFGADSGTNYDGINLLWKVQGASNFHRKAFLAFDFSSIPADATIDSATLRLYSNNSQQWDCELYGIDDSSDEVVWDETTITQDNYSNSGSAATDAFSGSIDSLIDSLSEGSASSGDKDFTVTSWVSSRHPDSFCTLCVISLDTSNSTTYGCRSKENAASDDEKPRLIINYTEAGPTYTLTQSTEGDFDLNTSAKTNLYAGRKLEALSENFDVVVPSLNFVSGYALLPLVGNVSTSAPQINLKKQSALQGESGAYNCTGSNADLTYSRILSALTGSIITTGNNAQLSRGFKLTVGQNDFVMTGSSADLKAGRRLAAQMGSFALTALDSNLTLTRKLTASGDSLTTSGYDADFEYTPASITMNMIRMLM